MPAQHRKIFLDVRQKILTGAIANGTRLPSTRNFSKLYNISRTTAVKVFELLKEEGLIVSKIGSGSFVKYSSQIEAPSQNYNSKIKSDNIPNTELSKNAIFWKQEFNKEKLPGSIPPCEQGSIYNPFFPDQKWRNQIGNIDKNTKLKLSKPSMSCVNKEISKAIAHHIELTQRINCIPEQILILPNVSSAYDLICSVLCQGDEIAWVEELCTLQIQTILRSYGSKISLLPVGLHGLSLQRLTGEFRVPKLITVSPSPNYPYCDFMSLEKKKALINFVKNCNTWIIEYNHDAELLFFNTENRPLASFDSNGKVIYIGSFDKMLFPYPGLSYIVVPQNLIEYFVAAKSCRYNHLPNYFQYLFADYLNSGSYLTMLNKLRNYMKICRKKVIETCHEYCPYYFEFSREFSGSYLFGELKSYKEEMEVIKAAQKSKVALPVIGDFTAEKNHRKFGAIFGYATSDEHTVMRNLKTFLRTLSDMSFKKKSN